MGMACARMVMKFALRSDLPTKGLVTGQSHYRQKYNHIEECNISGHSRTDSTHSALIAMPSAMVEYLATGMSGEGKEMASCQVRRDIPLWISEDGEPVSGPESCGLRSPSL